MPLVWRRRAPLVVASVVGVAAALYGAAELPEPPLMFGPLLAWYTAAAYRPRRLTLPFAGIAALVGVGSMAFARDSDAADVAVNLFAGAMAWVVGDSTRSDRERARLLAERRDDAERQAVAEERVRIARDLHDVVAHHVSVIAVQAEAAQSVLGGRPGPGREGHGQRGRHRPRRADRAAPPARRACAADAAAGAAARPAALDELVDSVRRTGLAVTVHVDDEAAAGRRAGRAWPPTGSCRRR